MVFVPLKLKTQFIIDSYMYVVEHYGKIKICIFTLVGKNKKIGETRVT